MSVKTCPVCGAVRNERHREAVRRAKLVVRMAKGAGLIEPLRAVVAQRLRQEAE